MTCVHINAATLYSNNLVLYPVSNIIQRLSGTLSCIQHYTAIVWYFILYPTLYSNCLVLYPVFNIIQQLSGTLSSIQHYTAIVWYFIQYPCNCILFLSQEHLRYIVVFVYNTFVVDTKIKLYDIIEKPSAV